MPYILSFCSLILAVACQSPAEKTASKKLIHSVNKDQLLQSIARSERDYVVVNFYATWCKPCIQELPELVALQNDPESEASVLLVSIDAPEIREHKLDQFLSSFDINFPTYHLSPDSLENLVRKVYPEWNTSIPLNFVYTNTGRLVEVTGMTDRTEISMIIHEDQSFHSL